MKKVLTFLALATLAASAAPALAAVDAPLWSAKRLSIGLGANYEVANNPFPTSEPVLDRKQEFSAGVYAAYNLTPDASLVASSVGGLSSRQVRTSVGVRLRIFRGDK